MGTKLKPLEYEWLGDLSPTSQLTARDICQIYKLNSTAFYQRINRGTFPPHDKVGQYNENKHYWYVDTVLKQVKKDLQD